MSDTKMECPSCGSWTNAIGQAALAGEPCPYCGRPLPKVERGPMSGDDARGLGGLHEDEFEDLVDAVLMDVGEPIFTLDETAKVVARLIEQREAAARAEGRREVREAVERLADDWADFEHDAVTCPKFDCGDCTMLNAIHDLRAVLAGQGGEGK